MFHRLRHLRFSLVLAVGGAATVVLFMHGFPKSNAEKVASPGTVSQDDKGLDQRQKLADLMKQIAGKENLPAEQVFKNIQMFKGVPAARLLRIMELGYSRSLGVNCAHCHVVDQWDKDDKQAKQIAREMAKMSQTINDDLLKNIKNLKGPNPVVNCTTCHRGQVKPALNLADSAPK
jgi:photosynthetic reaction center cytochrome c subunit